MTFLRFLQIASLSFLFINPGHAQIETNQQPPGSLPPIPAQRTAVEPTTKSAELKWRSYKVKKGDSLSKIFSRLDINQNSLLKILRLGQPVTKLKLLKPGEILKFQIDSNGKLARLSYPLNKIESLEIQRKNNKYHLSKSAENVQRKIASASVTIQSSLFVDGKNAGLPDNLTMQIAEIFGWDIDFALNLRKGDQFTLIYENIYLDGKKLETGPILAAEFINRNKSYKAVRFTDEKGEASYFSPEGLSQKKAFLRTPVKYARISSRFNLRRKHPVLNRIRAHKGVDYAAPRGTPVRATSNGKITFRGRKGGYGNTIIVKHGKHYRTLYAHLSKFRRSAKKGSNIKQGQIIGYIGSTGLATGPHLHYELRVDGVHRNPLTVRLPKATQISTKEFSLFKQQTTPLLAELNSAKKVLLAQAK